MEMSAKATPARASGTVSGAASLVLALSLSASILVYPRLLVGMNHAAMSLMMLGLCASFVHGVGFVPSSKLWRQVFSPLLAWPLMGLVFLQFI